MIETIIHPTEQALADYLNNTLSEREKIQIEEHLACCSECLEKIIAAYESVKSFEKDKSHKKGRLSFMKKINPYFILTIIAFALSFVIPRYFIQLLVATLLLGIKWIVDSKSTKMLVMIYEAWKKGGEKEASRILETIDSGTKKRF